MNYENEKVKIGECKTICGVYGVLERAGLDTSVSLEKLNRRAVNAMHFKESELIQCAIMRLRQIDYTEA